MGRPIKITLLTSIVLAALAASHSLASCAEQAGEATSKNKSVGQAVTITIPVEGMSCGSCAASIKRATKAIGGVSDVHVDLVARQARVEYDPSRTSPEAIRSAIEALGYKAGMPVTEKR